MLFLHCISRFEVTSLKFLRHNHQIIFHNFSLNPLNPTPITAKNHYAWQKVFVDAPLTKNGTSRRKRCIQCIRWILHIQISLSTLNSLEFWDQIFPKRVFLVQNRKSSHHNWILHIWLRLGSKFQVKLAILISWTKFAQNWYSNKLHFCMCPWSLLTILNLFARWPTDTTTFQCLFSF